MSDFVAYAKTLPPGGPNGQATAPTGQEIARDVGAGGRGGEIAKNGDAANVQSLLEQKPKSSTPGIPGMDTGKAQAIGYSDVFKPVDPIEIAKDVKNWVNEQGETKIIIVNRSSVELRFSGKKELRNPKQAKWVTTPPGKIPAGGQDYMIVKTDMMIRGVARADTSGWVLYEADDTERNRTGTVKIGWLRKGDGTIDDGASIADVALRKNDDEVALLEIDPPQQTKEGEFKFVVTETAPVKKPKKPQTDGSKDAKSAAPPDTYVLFKQNEPNLSAEAESKLHKFARAYVAAKSTATIYVNGYASLEGPEGDNKTLSFKRAEAVFKYLISDAEKLPGGNIEWQGQEKPTNQFDPKRFEPNRRVTISLSGAKGSAATPPDTKPKEPQSPTKVPQTKDKDEPPERPLNPYSASRPGA
jgi:outer membrane protein OmpA-like peptidoglycan-associated protein